VSVQISLIICTRNRADQLTRCLEYVDALEQPPGNSELVLVDNGSTDISPAIIREFKARARMPVLDVYEPRPGLARARNAGLARASGAILAFTDDDCYVRSDFLLQMIRCFEQPAIGYVGGRVVLHDPSDALVAIKDCPAPRRFEPYHALPAGVIHGANMAVLRTALKAVGGFDPLLGAGTPLRAGEDIEFLARLCWAGWTGLYDPGPSVAHHHGRKPGADVRKLSAAYDYGRGAYYASALLNPRARPSYLRHWSERVRGYLRAHDLASPRREVLGALRYLLLRLATSREAPPRI
jgi:glycosyltransferase involved in cell wall biosynthesis